ncbi:MAG: DUF1992 domain-containing protein [Calditrichaeota bacterium]|nr:MAG: DUF1992 domain-containing protein [Calditrichota bacterium]
MHPLHWIAEQRIREAIEAGELDNIPGMGKPLKLDGEHLLDSETRLAYTVLKNSGFLPYPLLLRKEIEGCLEHLDNLLENCRFRVLNVLNLIGEVWAELSCYFPSNEKLMKALRLAKLPEGFNPSGIEKPSKSFLHKKKKIQKMLDNLKKYIHAHNETIELFRRKYLVALQEVNQKISDLKFECLKEEIRRKKPLLCNLDMNFINIEKKLKKFDREFQKFELMN